MPHAVYKLIHFFGLFGMVTLLAGAAMHALVGHTRAERPFGRGFAIAHGIGAFLVLLGGFGMLARIGMVGGLRAFPAWLWVKIGVWFLIGGISGVPYRKPELAMPVMVVTPLLAGVAAYFALYKPF
jgi:hypothetical protein